MKWITDFLSGESDKSSKRLVFLVASAVLFIQHFLLMYLKIEITNKELVSSSQQYVFYLACGAGLLVAGEKMNISLGKKEKTDVPQ